MMTIIIIKHLRIRFSPLLNVLLFPGFQLGRNFSSSDRKTPNDTLLAYTGYRRIPSLMTRRNSCTIRLPITSGAPPATVGDWQVEIKSWLVSTLAVLQRRKGLERFSVGCIGTLISQSKF
jgi:hypothetical protein